MTYEDLLEECRTLNIKVKELTLNGSDGRCLGNRIAIDKNLKTIAEKRCTLAEELGHYHLTVGDITDLSDVRNKKQELKARRYGYNLLIEPDDLVHAMKNGCNNKYEIAEYLNISESCFDEIIEDFKKQYGIGVWVGNYYLQFEPYLGLIKDFGGLFNYK